MPSTTHPTTRLDPVFIVMLVAVILAVATSFTLRLAIGGISPSRARAAEPALAPHHPPTAKPPALAPAQSE